MRNHDLFFVAYDYHYDIDSLNIIRNKFVPLLLLFGSV
jgi:hypothetical protein